MNITNITISNISKYITINPRYCEVLEVHLNYNLFIILNFVFFMLAFLEMKKEVLTKLEIETGIDIKMIYFIAMLIFNVCMFLFQFTLVPLSALAGG